MSNVTSYVEMLGWMLIHSLWILAIINTFAWLTLMLLRQQSAQARYIVGCLAMLLSLVSLPVTLVFMKVPYPETQPVIPVVSPTNGDQEPRPQRTTESDEEIERPLIVENLSIEIARPSPVPAESTPPIRINSAQQPDTTTGMQQSLSMIGHWVRPYLTWMVGTWTAGVLLLSLRPLIGWWYVRRLRRAGLMSVDGAVQRTVMELVQRLRIRQVVAVFQSALVDVPCVVGAWKPVILLPAAVLTGLTTDQLEAVLAHELAHIRRHDFFINILQTLVETLLFYHPAIWWLSSRIRQEREHCCDDIAIGLLGDVAGYATMLLSLERMRIRIVPSTVAAGGGSLVQRIRRLTNAPAVESRSPAMSLIVMATVLAIAGSWAWGSAQTRQKEIGETNTVSQETQDATLIDPPTGKIAVTGPAPGSWPQWGGSSLRNHVASGRLPLDWSIEKGTNLLWKVKLGTNTYSSPVIADGKVLIGTNNGSGLDPRHPKEVDMSCLVCFDQQSGQMLWQYASKKLPAGRVYDWPQIGLCSSPSVHGDRVWFISNRCEVVCLDLNGFRDRENDGPINDETTTTDVDADVVWKFDMFEKLGVRPLHQSVSCITLVDGLFLMNTSNGPDESYTRVPAPDAPSFLALNASTGEVVWKHTSAPEAVAIGGSACSNVGASPAAGTINGVTQVIFTGREGWVYGFDFADLKKGQSTVLWSFDCNPKSSTYSVGGTSRRNTILSTPVIWENRVYVATGRNPEMGDGPADLWCIDPSRRGDISSELVFNKSFENGTTPIPRKYNPACNPQAGDFVLPNPNSGAVWHLEPHDRNGNGKIDFAESFHRTIGTPAIHDGLLFIADLTGLLHCIDARAGKVHWVHDLQSSVWGSCLIADGHVLLGNEDGDLKIFKASPNMEIVKTENFGHQIYTTPVLVNDTLFVASHASLFALHDPKQIAAAPQDVQEVSKDTKPATLVLTDSQDKPVGGTVHVGIAGYSSDLQKLRAWETTRQGVIELTGLAAGKHTLVADASTDSPTIFGIELPAESLPIRQRLNPRAELSSVNGVDPLEIRTKLITRSGHSVIDVEFTNKTDKPITLPLLSMVDFDFNLRVFIPKKLVADDITIPPHRTRTIPLNWTRIVKEGIWTSRSLESIDEPWPVKAAGDGLRYFRLDVGRVGTLPLALPKPELVLQRTEVPTVDSEPPTQAATREFPLGNFGGVPQRGAQPAPMSPEARTTADNTTPWIDAEYFLQYRIRVSNNGPDYSGKAAAPLLLLDLRNTGKLNLALEKVQSRHEVVVDQVDYFRNDQPWGGIDPVNETGFCIPFLLTSDWKSRPSKGEEGLSLIPGTHAVVFRIKLHETSRNADGQLVIEPRGGRVLTTRPVNIEFHEPETELTKALAVENIRRELIAFPRFFAPKVSDNLQQLVRNTQPESGDFLLKSRGSGNMTAPDPASFVIAQTWENLSRAQREQYLKSSMIHFAEMRPTYPQGVDAGIAVGPRFASDYAGVPASKPEVKSKTVTTHFLDGQQVGEPMTYPLHTAISHWFRTGSLPLGKHSIRLVTEYEFQRGDESYTGKFESERTFEIVANGPDMLLAPSDPVVDKFVYKSIEIVEASAQTTWGGRGWQPQMRWRDKDGQKQGSLHTPSWRVTQPLPVDLCFHSELRLEETDQTIPGSEIVVPAGQVTGIYFRPLKLESYQILKARADAEGFVKTRLVLTPSRGVALSDPRIRRYFGGTITSDVVRVRVDRDEIGKEFEELPGKKP